MRHTRKEHRSEEHKGHRCHGETPNNAGNKPPLAEKGDVRDAQDGGNQAGGQVVAKDSP